MINKKERKKKDFIVLEDLKDDARADVVDEDTFNLEAKKDEKGNLRQEIMERFEEIAKQYSKTKGKQDEETVNLGQKMITRSDQKEKSEVKQQKSMRAKLRLKTRGGGGDSSKKK